MIISSFDLSTTCTGALISEIDNNDNIIRVKSAPIIPEKFSPSELGYLNSKKKIVAKNGKVFSAYLKPEEKNISQAEKKRRDIEVRNFRNNKAISEISYNISEIVTNTRPNIILVEKNKIFNGILTSVLLGELMGSLEGVASANGVPVLKIDVETARKIFNLTELTKKYISPMGYDEICKIPDITKRALRIFMEETYGKKGLRCSTDDEGDAAVIFHYFFTNLYKDYKGRLLNDRR